MKLAKPVRIALTISFIFAQIFNDLLSFNEIACNSVTSFESDPKYRTARLSLLFVALIAVTPLAILLGIIVYGNSVMSEEEHHSHDEHHGVAHRIQDFFLSGYAAVYGFAGGLSIAYFLDEFRSEKSPDWGLYLASTLVGLSFSWGYTQFHSHAVEISSNNKGIASWDFIKAAFGRILTHPIIAVTSMGEAFYIPYEGIKQLAKGPDLTQHFYDYQYVYIIICLLLSVFGLIEANTIAASMVAKADKERFNTQIPAQRIDEARAKYPILSKLALFAGIDHTFDHVTGIVRQLIGVLILVMYNSKPRNWADVDTLLGILLRTGAWGLGAATTIKTSSTGFRDTLIEQWDRYAIFKAKKHPATVKTPLLSLQHEVTPMEFPTHQV